MLDFLDLLFAVSRVGVMYFSLGVRHQETIFLVRRIQYTSHIMHYVEHRSKLSCRCQISSSESKILPRI
jgi:hypothetical protein